MKQMKEYIIELSSDDENALSIIAKAYNLHELIRCQDCINYGNNGCRLKRMAYQTAPDWYCADGERRESE